MKLTYRKATPKDFDLLLKLDGDAFNRYFDIPFTRDELGELLSKSEVSLIYSGQNPVGYYAWELQGKDQAEIIGVVVTPEYQKKGMGTQVVRDILDELGSTKKIKIVTHPHNVAALKLYFKFGFRIAELKPDYYGENQPRLILYKIKKEAKNR